MRFAKDKLEWLEFDLLKSYPSVVHGSFTKHGGTSEGNFASLNVSNDVGDHPDNVKANRELILNALDLSSLVFPQQQHGSKVVEVTAQNASKHHACDAMFTQEKNLGLVIANADCQAALFYDPESEMVGVAHAGWKGSVKNVYQNLVDAMKRAGANPKNIIVCISPSLGPDHAEFVNYRKELPEDFWSYQASPEHFNFWDISRKQLDAAGISDKNIEIAETCTFCDSKDYFSFRREKKTGRHATIIGLK